MDRGCKTIMFAVAVLFAVVFVHKNLVVFGPIDGNIHGGLEVPRPFPWVIITGWTLIGGMIYRMVRDYVNYTHLNQRFRKA